MTVKSGNTFIIEPEPPRKCELCGALEECRPYGPKGEQVCYACGMKDKEAVSRAIEARMFGPSEVPTDRN